MNELNQYLHSLCGMSGLEAVALATEDGELVAGAGKGDVEYMGVLGAQSRLTRLNYDGRVLHVRRLEVNDVEMCLTMVGQDVSDAVPRIQTLLQN